MANEETEERMQITWKELLRAAGAFALVAPFGSVRGAQAQANFLRDIDLWRESIKIARIQPQ